MTYSDRVFMPLSRQLFDRTLADALSDLARQKYGTAKLVARAWALSERGKIVDRRTDIAPGKVELEPVDDDRDDGEVIDDAAAKLKRDGWTKPTEAEADVGETEAAGELEPA